MVILEGKSRASVGIVVGAAIGTSTYITVTSLVEVYMHARRSNAAETIKPLLLYVTSSLSSFSSSDILVIYSPFESPFGRSSEKNENRKQAERDTLLGV